MSKAHGYLKDFLSRLSTLRQGAGISSAELEERLILGPGWIDVFESGDSIPTLDMVLAILHEIGSSLDGLLESLPQPEAATIERCLFAEQAGNDIKIYFPYAKHDAEYSLSNATVDQFEAVIKVLRDGLARLAVQEKGAAEAIKSDSVAETFLTAVRVWPQANPSDLWWFVVYRAYCDPFNHPAAFARLDFSQSWKRTGGWALEQIVIRHYGQYLKQNGINLEILDSPTKDTYVSAAGLNGRIEADKIDLVLTGDTPSGRVFFGIVNVKASFAERRTDDVPLSRALSAEGYTTPLWTMDCKSTPSRKPVNRGELGRVVGRRSAKRRDIEDEGEFTGCFSYNSNTEPSPLALPDEKRVQSCNFNSADDPFTQFLLERWRKFQTP